VPDVTAGRSILERRKSDDQRVDSLRRLRSDTQGGLFFSMYVEGSGTEHKVLQLFNPYCDEVSLEEYELYITSNGGDIQTMQLAGSLGGGGLFIICGMDFYGQCNLQDSFISHNGDDAYALVWNGEVVDVIGVLGERENWAVAGEDAATKDHTLVRKSEVLAGNVDWAASAGTTEDNSEWIVQPKDTLDSLECHTATHACDTSVGCPEAPPPPYSPPPMPSPPKSPPIPLYPPGPPGYIADVQLNSSDMWEAGALLADAVGTYYVMTIQLSCDAAINETLPMVNRQLIITGDEVEAGQYRIDAQGSSGVLAVSPGGNVTVVNVAIVNGLAQQGAAVWLDGDAHLTLQSCTLANHSVQQQGTIYAEAGAAVIRILDTLLRNNSAGDSGSAIYATLGGETRLELSGSRVENCTGSAVTVSRCGSVVLSECDVRDVVSTSNGAVVGWSSCESNGSLTVASSYFGQNQAHGYGGAVNLFSFANGTVDIAGSAFVGNVVTGTALSTSSCQDGDAKGDGSGAALGCSGGTFLRLLVTASLMANNSAQGDCGNGGAVQVGTW
ncbi:hypothetical protein CYMTET_25666, partial [Cymbomonas tetramitiformis]